MNDLYEIVLEIARRTGAFSLDELNAIREYFDTPDTAEKAVESPATWGSVVNG